MGVNPERAKEQYCLPKTFITAKCCEELFVSGMWKRKVEAEVVEAVIF